METPIVAWERNSFRNILFFLLLNNANWNHLQNGTSILIIYEYDLTIIIYKDNNNEIIADVRTVLHLVEP